VFLCHRTETEVHAELCYAEVLLLKAVLTLCEDETLVSFVKAGLKVRTCYQSFRYSVREKRFTKDHGIQDQNVDFYLFKFDNSTGNVGRSSMNVIGLMQQISTISKVGSEWEWDPSTS